jgi:hypothetical protein
LALTSSSVSVQLVTLCLQSFPTCQHCDCCVEVSPDSARCHNSAISSVAGTTCGCTPLVSCMKSSLHMFQCFARCHGPQCILRDNCMVLFKTVVTFTGVGTIPKDYVCGEAPASNSAESAFSLAQRTPQWKLGTLRRAGPVAEAYENDHGHAQAALLQAVAGPADPPPLPPPRPPQALLLFLLLVFLALVHTVQVLVPMECSPIGLHRTACCTDSVCSGI